MKLKRTMRQRPEWKRVPRAPESQGTGRRSSHVLPASLTVQLLREILYNKISLLPNLVWVGLLSGCQKGILPSTPFSLSLFFKRNGFYSFLDQKFYIQRTNDLKRVFVLFCCLLLLTVGYCLCFLLCHVACGVLVPQPGTELRPSTVKALSLNH